MHSPYAGPLSQHAQGDTKRSDTFGAYFGVALPWYLAFYFDVEMLCGAGVSGAPDWGAGERGLYALSSPDNEQQIENGKSPLQPFGQPLPRSS